MDCYTLVMKWVTSKHNLCGENAYCVCIFIVITFLLLPTTGLLPFGCVKTRPRPRIMLRCVCVRVRVRVCVCVVMHTGENVLFLAHIHELFPCLQF